jgi:hypothetical protein
LPARVTAKKQKARANRPGFFWNEGWLIRRPA